MYIDSLELQDFRTFRKARVDFLHRETRFADLKLPRPRLPNVNLLLGNNGVGKTAMLKAIALAALGPAVGQAGLFPYRLVRREGTKVAARAEIHARFTPHPQDRAGEHALIESAVTVERKGDLEVLEWRHDDEKRWHPIYDERSDAFFFVGYGSSRTVERAERVDPAARQSSAFARAQRVRSVFEETYSLIPLSAWLPRMRHENRGRYQQVAALISRLAGRGRYRFTGELEDGEYLFEKRGQRVPFRALSDGYRAFLGWVGDLLFHVAMTCPSGKKLVENRGIVMIDEIDLHLHPEWQMTVLPTLARTLRNLQFIVTSHSPLIVGSLEWMNIIVMRNGPKESSRPQRVSAPVHGLDADQVLLTEFFGLESTRASATERHLHALTMRARKGDATAAKELFATMSRGAEADA